MTATLDRPAPAYRPADDVWEQLSDDAKETWAATRAAELDAEEAAVAGYRRAVGGILHVAAQLAHQLREEHDLACSCAGCQPVLPDPLAETGPAYRRMRADQGLVYGILTTAAFGAEWAASALEGITPDAFKADGKSWSADLRALADMLDAADEQWLAAGHGDD